MRYVAALTDVDGFWDIVQETIFDHRIVNAKYSYCVCGWDDLDYPSHLRKELIKATASQFRIVETNP